MSQNNDLLNEVGRLVNNMGLGQRAFTVQNYIEVNSKFGVQYEAAIYDANVTAGSSLYVEFTTGSDPVSMKLVDVESTSDSLSYQWFKTPTTSGGTTLTIYNLNDKNPVAGALTGIDNPTVTAEGTPISPEVHVLGQATVGQQGGGAGGVAGLERILTPNTTYLYKITNTNGTAQKVASYFSWYEGSLDYPQ